MRDRRGIVAAASRSSGAFCVQKLSGDFGEREREFIACCEAQFAPQPQKEKKEKKL
jgi:hypothetical protein